MDSLELRMAGSDQANRALLEQLMKLNQDIKVKSHEKMPKVQTRKYKIMSMYVAHMSCFAM